ncbi:hypothetical protein ACFRDU_38140, partial [Streptomyces sp. NPDC056661]
MSASLTLRAVALFELTDATLCADRLVESLIGLALAVEHRRGIGAGRPGCRCLEAAAPRACAGSGGGHVLERA